MQATAALQSVSSTSPSAAADSLPPPSATDLHAQIAERAYLRAQLRGFAPGLELDDWLAAEAEFKADTDTPEPAVPV